MTVRGKDLRVGDVVSVWWQPGRDSVTALRPYSGPLAFLWDKNGGAQIATFALLPSREMTIEPLDHFDVICRAAVGED